jgi:PhoPQ-activated pathogenicity-related protein
VNGTNDPYWTVNSTSVYWNDLKQSKWLLEVPNSGHGLEDKGRVVSTVGAFARSLAGQFKMPKLEAKMTVDKDHNTAKFAVDAGSKDVSLVSIWKAESMTKDFRGSKWIESKQDKNSNPEVEFNPNVNNAVFVEVKYTVGGKSFTLSTPVQIISQPQAN